MKIPSILYKLITTINFGFSPLLAISITEIVNVEMSAFTPFGDGAAINFIWQILQGFVGWVFGWFSDKHWRKNVLVLSQLAGVLGGGILLIFGFKPWVMILVGLTFSPLPVARAALMDEYPNQPMVKLMAITFFAQWLPWAFYGYLTKLHYATVIYFVLIALLFNSIFTFFFLNENTELIKEKNKLKEEAPSLSKLSSWKLVLFTLLALGLAEATFFLIVDKLENNAATRRLWWPSIGFMTFLGNFLAIFYRPKPNVSLLSGCYLLGFCFCLGAFFNFILSIQTASSAMESSITSYALIGGLYLPLAYAIVLNRVSPLHRGAACGALDMVELIAALGATVILLPLNLNNWQTLLTFTFMYLGAAIVQKFAAYYRLQKNT